MARKPTTENGAEMATTEIESGEAVAGTGKQKRARVTQSVYLKGDSTTKDPREADGLRIEVLNGGGVEEIRLAALSPEIVNAAAIFGLKLKGTNGIGGKSGADAFEDLQTIYENIRNGEWSDRAGAGEGGVPSMLAAAIHAAYVEAGKDVTLESVKESMKDKDETWRKTALSNKSVRAHYDRLRAEAAAARAAKSAGEAGGASVDDLGLSL